MLHNYLLSVQESYKEKQFVWKLVGICGVVVVCIIYTFKNNDKPKRNKHNKLILALDEASRQQKHMLSSSSSIQNHNQHHWSQSKPVKVNSTRSSPEPNGNYVFHYLLAVHENLDKIDNNNNNKINNQTRVSRVSNLRKKQRRSSPGDYSSGRSTSYSYTTDASSSDEIETSEEMLTPLSYNRRQFVHRRRQFSDDEFSL